jgi:AAHS family 4-hydroxybenzoate transporter-like MFS transporter
MEPSRCIDIAQLVDEQKIGLFNVRIVFLSFLVMLSDGYDLAAVAYAAPGIVASWHINRAALGPVFSAGLLGMLFGGPILGYIGDRLGRRPGIILGCIIYGIPTVIIGGATSLPQLIILRFISGIGLGGLPPNAIALNAEFAPKRLRATLIILMFMGVTFGGILPGVVSAHLPYNSWKMLFIIGGVGPIVAAFLMFLFLPESIKFLVVRRKALDKVVKLAKILRPGLDVAPDAVFLVHEEKLRKGWSVRLLFGDGLKWITSLLWLLFAVNLMANFFLNSWMPTVFRGAGLSVQQTALTAGMYYAGGIMGALSISLLLDRWGLAIITAYFVISCPVVASIGTPGISAGLLKLAVFISGFCVLGIQNGLNAVSGLVYPTAVRSNGAGWASSIGRLGAIVGPMVGGLLIGMHVSLRGLFVAPTVPLAIGAAGCLLLMRLCIARFGGHHFEESVATSPPMSTDEPKAI